MEKTVILNQNRDFLQLYQRGKKIASPYVIIYLRKTRRKHNRLGITVGKKVGCAVKRSRGYGDRGAAVHYGYTLYTTA